MGGISFQGLILWRWGEGKMMSMKKLTKILFVFLRKQADYLVFMGDSMILKILSFFLEFFLDIFSFETRLF